MGISFLKRLFGGGADSTSQLPEMTDAPAAEAQDAAPAAESAPTEEDLAAFENFIRFVVCALVDQPEQVTISKVQKADLTVLQIHCFKKDVGKIIGKSGKTISALRTLVKGAAGRSGLRVTVDVMDD